MAYLLDTNVLSEVQKPRPDERVVAWIQAQTLGETYVSVITLGELQQGIVRAVNPDRRAALEAWLTSDIRAQFRGRILPVDEAVMLTWGQLTGEAIKRGQRPSAFDSLLAATAITHGLTLVTRNTKDMAALPVAVLNPWESQ